MSRFTQLEATLAHCIPNSPIESRTNIDQRHLGFTKIALGEHVSSKLRDLVPGDNWPQLERRTGVVLREDGVSCARGIVIPVDDHRIVASECELLRLTVHVFVLETMAWSTKTFDPGTAGVTACEHNYSFPVVTMTGSRGWLVLRKVPV